MFNHKWQRQNGHRKVRTSILAALVTVSLLFTMTAFGGEISSVAQIKAAFDVAMGKPLNERIPLLEALEQDIDQTLFQGGFDEKIRAAILRLKYRVQLEQAKYPESRATFLGYLDALEQGHDREYSRLAFRRRIEVMVQREEWFETEALCKAVKDQYPNEESTKGVALYHMGLSCMRMNGTMQKARDFFSQMVQECSDHPLRPWGLRMLANCHLSIGDMDACLGTLEIMKQQYKDTKWEQYGDMRPAFVHEHQKGDAQKALEIYEETLRKYPDHIYWAYIEKQKVRLQKVIEEQLIKDALKDLVKTEGNKCDGRSAEMIGFRIIRDQKLAISR